MNRTTTAKILLLLAIATVAISEQPIKVKYRYKAGFMLKPKDFYAFDVAAAIDFTAADDESKLEIKTNWGEIRKEPKIAANIKLPDEFKASVTLRVDTTNGFLNLVGYKVKDKKCLVALFYDEFTFRTLTFSTLSRFECSRVRVSRYKKGTNRKLISYITDDGTFKWIARLNKDDTSSNWNTVNKNLFKDGILDPKEFHDVQMLYLYYHNQEPKFLFVIYQKARGVQSNKYFPRVSFLWTKGDLDQSSTLTFSTSVNDWFQMSEMSSNDYSLEHGSALKTKLAELRRLIENLVVMILNEKNLKSPLFSALKQINILEQLTKEMKGSNTTMSSKQTELWKYA